MSSIASTACFTGHRPSKFPFSTKDKLNLDIFLSTVYLLAYEAVTEFGIDTFYCGMQRGMDVWGGQQVLRIKEEFPDIKLICLSPYQDEIYERKGDDLKDYIALVNGCDEFIALHQKYVQGCYFERNRYMVDHSSYIIGAAVPGVRSGTDNTVKYAKKLGRKLHIIDLEAFGRDYGLV